MTHPSFAPSVATAALSAFFAACAPLLSRAERTEIEIAPGERWWGGRDTGGSLSPLGADSPARSFDLRTSNDENHAAPVFVSSRGRWLWCDEPFAFAFRDGRMTFTSDSAPFVTGTADENTLRGAFRAVAARFFPSDGRVPPADFFAYPQWNTWIELTYNQNEKAIRNYVDSIVANGFPQGGVVMIDDTWQTGYGQWRFEPTRFADPKGLCRAIRARGFRTMFWVCPFVSMDTPEFRRLETAGGLLRDATTKLARPLRWWNGMSAVLDLTNEVDAKWFRGELKRLTDEFGVDGFKFDAGDFEYYPADAAAKKSGTAAVEQCRLYGALAAEFPYNEYRATWKAGGRPVVARLKDKGHSWEETSCLIPDMITAGLIGCPFVCPDMIGGGLWTTFQPGSNFEPELFVRSAQVHALAPMMQFSAAPWRVLDKTCLDAVRKAVAIRQTFAPRFVELAAESAKTGEPMLRSLEYNYPGRGYAGIVDEFMMGDFLLVAPQLARGAKERKVVLPPGRWTADDGTTYDGPAEIVVSTPLDRLPYFVPANGGASRLDAITGRIPGLVACWDFGRADAPLTSAGKVRATLAAGAGAHPETVAGGPFSGRALRFDGKSDYLTLPYAETGALNVRSGQVTVVGWVKWIPGAIGFVGGMWNEYQDGGKRQYGLFVSLPHYNGGDQVCGHISRTGGPTPPFPYSIDYSASAQKVPGDVWCCVAFTYDGECIRSYLNGEFKAREPELIDHTKGFPGYPDGLVQSKNPYRYPDGIGDNGSDFTVGAVCLARGMGNFFHGDIAGLAVFDRALTEDELRTLAR